MQLLKKKSWLVLAVLLVMLIGTVPFSAGAASSVPVIKTPKQYQIYNRNDAVNITWSAPSGTVKNYVISVRHLSMFEKKPNRLIVNQVSLSASTKSYKLSRLAVDAGSNYRISVCAVLTNGSKKWSTETYFCSSIFRKGTGSHYPYSFKISELLEDETKNAIYYSCRPWNNANPDSSITEMVNTFPFSVTTPVTALNNSDGVNSVFPRELTTEHPIMGTWTRIDDNTFEGVETDIMINKHVKWSNGVTSGCFEVQNVMTHEMGHACGLPDIYQSYAKEWTMYGDSEVCETKKKTLESNDKAMLNVIMG